MIKLLAIILVLFIASAAGSHAQYLLTSFQGEEYLGVIINETRDSLSIKTLEDKEFRICRDSIEYADTMKTRIELQSGEVYIGPVVRTNEKEFVILSGDSDEIEIQRNLIADIQICDIDGDFTFKSIIRGADGKEYPDFEVVKDNYHMFGATFGYPGMFNLMYGYQGNKFGMRVCAGFTGFSAGIKASFVYNLQKLKYIEHSLALTVGASIVIANSPYNGVSYGATYSLNAFGIFVEIGVALGADIAGMVSRDSTSPKVIGQFGYVWRFN